MTKISIALIFFFSSMYLFSSSSMPEPFVYREKAYLSSDLRQIYIPKEGMEYSLILIAYVTDRGDTLHYADEFVLHEESEFYIIEWSNDNKKFEMVDLIVLEFDIIGNYREAHYFIDNTLSK